MTTAALYMSIIGGLIASYFIGFKFGVAVRMLKNLGNHA